VLVDTGISMVLIIDEAYRLNRTLTRRIMT